LPDTPSTVATGASVVVVDVVVDVLVVDVAVVVEVESSVTGSVVLVVAESVPCSSVAPVSDVGGWALAAGCAI